jgi:predicted metal-dependent HD superfamily phosphohydrolase
MLKQTFIALLQKYTSEFSLIDLLWTQIEKNYSNEKRFYHTLIHLENLLEHLNDVKDQIEDWDVILFSLFYHDVIYDTSINDNEEKSAELAKNNLLLISFPEKELSKCLSQILATKGHSTSTDHDTNLFTDADLSILGQSWNVYADYYKKIRKEYSNYSDQQYSYGRKKVLDYFVEKDKIYKTNYFFEKFEVQARQNLLMELKTLK